jgi:hypothetical protein
MMLDQNTTKQSLKIQMWHAGVMAGIERFHQFSEFSELAVATLFILSSTPISVAPGAAVAGPFGLPRQLTAVRRACQGKAFINSTMIPMCLTKSGMC